MNKIIDITCIDKVTYKRNGQKVTKVFYIILIIIILLFLIENGKQYVKRMRRLNNAFPYIANNES